MRPDYIFSYTYEADSKIFHPYDQGRDSALPNASPRGPACFLSTVTFADENDPLAKEIQNNSVLVEEAYNQEDGVVQLP